MSTLAAVDPEAAYYQAVEEYFVSRRGDPLFLSNADWNLVRKWRLAGLPLRVVLRGIRDALDAHAHGWSRDRKVGSLSYCAREVDAARERWERALALGREEGTDAASGPARVRRGPRPGDRPRSPRASAGRGDRPGAARARVGRAARGGDGVARRARGAPPRRDRGGGRGGPPGTALEAEVDAGLERWRGRMPARVVEQLKREQLARRRLEAHGLPRLSLFHLEAGGAA